MHGLGGVLIGKKGGLRLGSAQRRHIGTKAHRHKVGRKEGRRQEAVIVIIVKVCLD